MGISSSKPFKIQDEIWNISYTINNNAWYQHKAIKKLDSLHTAYREMIK